VSWAVGSGDCVTASVGVGECVVMTVGEVADEGDGEVLELVPPQAPATAKSASVAMTSLTQLP
jgi:hypothetical protein